MPDSNCNNGLDLEAHANHRGSSFGKRLGGQPSNIDFENRLAIDILKSGQPATDNWWWKMRAG